MTRWYVSRAIFRKFDIHALGLVDWSVKILNDQGLAFTPGKEPNPTIVCKLVYGRNENVETDDGKIVTYCHAFMKKFRCVWKNART